MSGYPELVVSNAATQTEDDSFEIVPHQLPSQTQTQDIYEFPHGCIVSINGYDLDYGRYKERKHAPIFYGVVEDPVNHDADVICNIKDDQVIVRFVVSGEYEWYDKKLT